MRGLYFFLLSLMGSLLLFMIFTFFVGINTRKTLKLNTPIQIILKSMEGETMAFWVSVNKGIKDASKEFSIPVEINGPQFEKEIDQQILILNRAIDEAPPLIILAATDFKRLSGSVKAAHNNGIPIITIDSGVDSQFPISFIGTNNIDAGKKAGFEMKRIISNSTRKDIAIVSHIKETTSAIDREAGVRASLKDNNIIGTWFCDVKEEKAYQIALELIKNENLGGIVALNEVAALGVARAISENNMKDQLSLVGFDNAVQELIYLEEGVIKATVVQRPYNMGYLAIKAAVEYLSNKDIESTINTGSILITKENMFRKEYQQLLFPFGY